MKLSKRDKLLRELQREGPFVFVPEGHPDQARSVEPGCEKDRGPGSIFHVTRLAGERRPGIRAARRHVKDALNFAEYTIEEKDALSINDPETYVKLQRAKSRVKKVDR